MTISHITPSWLGGMPLGHFLRQYWHRRPLFIKRAFDPSQLKISRDTLWALAADPNVVSRCVQQRRGQWHMQHGPLAQLPRARRHWTVLVQGVNEKLPAAADFLDTFRFMPHARLDDLMISYAVPGGGVGPHFDSYDVFLLQAHGTRRWRISAQTDLSLRPGLPLKILAHFTPTQEYLCEPGDLLYLPPRYAHDGVALDECMTYSVGFRAPANQELVSEFYQRFSEHLAIDGYYADPAPPLCRHPGAIPARLLEHLENLLLRHRPSRSAMSLFLGEYLSEPKPHVHFQTQRRSQQGFTRAALRHGLRLAAASIMLYDGHYVFFNGESYRVSRGQKKSLQILADQRRLGPEHIQPIPAEVLEQLWVWHNDGWLHIDTQ